ncbi:hypothetical protein K2X96_03385 [Patescibacteria group bacterium]|nr:hypothetical protein [Patescibacteria group bacterium]
MFESVRRKTPEKETISFETLVHELGISPDDLKSFIDLFTHYADEQLVDMTNESAVFRVVRHFITQHKKEIKEQFKDSVLGQSGCFAYSVRTSVLLGAMGIVNRLARATGTRMLHILVIDKNGVPYDPREITKGNFNPMSLSEIRMYGRLVQPVVAKCDSCRNS